MAVQIAERWILARLRHERFFSLAALNARIARAARSRSTPPDAPLRASRRELFVRLDRPALRPLPGRALRLRRVEESPASTSTTTSRSHGHYYSVPYRSWPRARRRPAHRPHRGDLPPRPARGRPRPRRSPRPAHDRHRPHAEGPPAAPGVDALPAHRLGRARSARRPPPLVEAILADRPHPEQGYRSCLGILRLASGDGAARLEAACARAVAVRRPLVPARRCDPEARPRPAPRCRRGRRAATLPPVSTTRCAGPAYYQ